jgi:hypothetical protein
MAKEMWEDIERDGGKYEWHPYYLMNGAKTNMNP